MMHNKQQPPAPVIKLHEKRPQRRCTVKSEGMVNTRMKQLAARGFGVADPSKIMSFHSKLC
jgi:hypothetical protein